MSLWSVEEEEGDVTNFHEMRLSCFLDTRTSTWNSSYAPSKSDKTMRGSSCCVYVAVVSSPPFMEVPTSINLKVAIFISSNFSYQDTKVFENLFVEVVHRHWLGFSFEVIHVQREFSDIKSIFSFVSTKL